MERDGYMCRLCGKSFPPADSVDHIIPRSRGGSHNVSNLQAAHMSCNLKKRAKLGFGAEPRQSRFDFVG